MNEFDRFLSLARRRRWMQSIIRCGTLGLTLGAGVGLLIGMICVLFPSNHVEWWVAALAIAGLAGGIVAGLARRPTPAETAMAIDGIAHLKDRVHTALQFSRMVPSDTYRELQLRDATRSLRAYQVAHLFPWRWPAEGTWAAGLLALAVLAALSGPRPRSVEARTTGPARAVVQESQQLAEELTHLEELAEDFQSEELGELGRKLQEMLKQLLSESQTAEDAMVHLAKMSAVVESAAAEFDPLLLQEALSDIGEGMTGLDGFEAAAETLKQGDYDQAASTMERFGQRVGAGQQAMPASGGLTGVRMGQLAEQANAAGLGELGDTLKSLQEAIQTGSRSECEGAMRRLGNLLRKYGSRAKVGRAMRLQLSRLGECKQCLGRKGGYCLGCRLGGECQGGGCKGIRSGLPYMSFSKSNSPSESAGTANSMNLFGSPTDLDARRNRVQVTGAMGDGESDTEIEHSPEGRQNALRSYRNVYAKYRKLSDAAMIEEAVPLGHRQIIKRYFELIHPDRVEGEELLRDVAEPVNPSPSTTGEGPSE